MYFTAAVRGKQSSKTLVKIGYRLEASGQHHRLRQLFISWPLSKNKNKIKTVALKKNRKITDKYTVAVAKE